MLLAYASGVRARTLLARSANPRGVTLIEVMIATAIVAIVAIQMSVFFAKGRFWFDQEEQKRAATYLAQEALEQARAMDPTTVAGWSESRTIVTATYDTRVTVQTDDPEPGMRTVKAKVTWTAARGSSRSLILTTLLYEN